MLAVEKANSGTKKYSVMLLNSTTFVDHKKNLSINTCIWVGCLNAIFARRGGGVGFEWTNLQNLNARELPRRMLKFRIDRPITSWARTLLLIKKWFKWSKNQWFFPSTLNLKRQSLYCLNVIVTKYSSCRARYSHMLSESYATVHFTYTRELRTILIKSFLVYSI